MLVGKANYALTVVLSTFYISVSLPDPKTSQLISSEQNKV